MPEVQEERHNHASTSLSCRASCAGLLQPGAWSLVVDHEDLSEVHRSGNLIHGRYAESPRPFARYAFLRSRAHAPQGEGQQGSTQSIDGYHTGQFDMVSNVDEFLDSAILTDSLDEQDDRDLSNLRERWAGISHVVASFRPEDAVGVLNDFHKNGAHLPDPNFDVNEFAETRVETLSKSTISHSRSVQSRH